MKHCPVCKTAYTDDSLRYCLADGAVLTSDTEEPTLDRKGDNARSVGVVGDGRRPIAGWQKALIAFAMIGLVFAAAIILMAGVLYMNTGGKAANIAAPLTSPSYTPPDPDKQRLQDELANLQRKVDEQKTTGRQAVNSNPFPTQSQPGTVTARVNSPNDGFLALRNTPDASGDRIAKIPHGATVALNNCEKNKASVDGRRGRWCQVEYAGQTGWVFDAWLVY